MQIVPSQGITLTGSHDRWDDCNITFMIMVIIKQKWLKNIKCMNKTGELYDVSSTAQRF